MEHMVQPHCCWR